MAQRDLYGIKEAHEAVRHGPMTRVGGIRGGGGEMQGERSRTVDFYFGRRVTAEPHVMNPKFEPFLIDIVSSTSCAQ